MKSNLQALPLKLGNQYVSNFEFYRLFQLKNRLDSRLLVSPTQTFGQAYIKNFQVYFAQKKYINTSSSVIFSLRELINFVDIPEATTK